MWQVRSFGTLCSSKRYLSEAGDIKKYISEVVKASEEWRKKQTEVKLNLLGWTLKVTHEQLLSGIEIVKIDVSLCPDWKSIFGESKPIGAPYFPDQQESCKSK